MPIFYYSLQLKCVTKHCFSAAEIFISELEGQTKSIEYGGEIKILLIFLFYLAMSISGLLTIVSRSDRGIKALILPLAD